MGILKEEREEEKTDSSGSSTTVSEAVSRDDQSEQQPGVFSDDMSSVNWEELMEMHEHDRGVVDNYHALEEIQFEAYDINEDLCEYLLLGNLFLWKVLFPWDSLLRFCFFFCFGQAGSPNCSHKDPKSLFVWAFSLANCLWILSS